MDGVAQTGIILTLVFELLEMTGEDGHSKMLRK